MLNKIKYYFREDLWNFRLDEEKGIRRFWHKCLRIGYLSIRGFIYHRCTLSASSLTYYTLMSIVPILALAFAIARGFGYHEVLKIKMLEHFEDQNTIVTELFKYSDRLLEQTKGGVIAGIGLIILFLTVAFLLSNLEAILNDIWGVKGLRSWKRILSDYFALMFITPIFFVVASSMTVFIVSHLEMAVRILPLSNAAISWLVFLIRLIPYSLFGILFTLIYLIMPNTKVHFLSACIAGFSTGALYVVVQWGYIHFQIGVNRYGAVYGSMAAVPLLLVWVQVGWSLFLFGAEMSCAYQTFNDHEFEPKVRRVSHHFKQLLNLWMTHLALRNGCLTKELLVKSYRIPIALCMPILQELVDCGILYETKQGYVPAHMASEMKISDVIAKLDLRGETQFPFIETKALAPFEKALDHFRAQIESSPENMRLKHVPHTI